MLTADLPVMTEGANIIGPGPSMVTIDGDQQFQIMDDPGVSNADDGCDIGAFERGALPLGPIFQDGFEIPVY